MTTVFAREASDGPAERSLPRLAVTVPDITHVEPGTGATLQVTVQNLAEEADHIELSFDGPGWAWLAPRRVLVGPGASAGVRLSAAPPRRGDSAPGRWPYAVVARSLRHPDRQAAAESALLLTTSSSPAPASWLEQQVVAARGPAKYVLSVANDRDVAVPAAVELIADGHLRTEAQATATVPARETIRLELTLTPRGRRLVRRRVHDFSLVVHVGADPPARLRAAYCQLPWMPARAVVLLALFATVAVVGLLSG
jgi:hypothetical protein